MIRRVEMAFLLGGTPYIVLHPTKVRIRGSHTHGAQSFKIELSLECPAVQHLCHYPQLLHTVLSAQEVTWRLTCGGIQMSVLGAGEMAQ